jgi:hypothetical protein
MSAFPHTTPTARRRPSASAMLVGLPLLAALVGALLALAFGRGPTTSSEPRKRTPAPAGPTFAAGDLRVSLPIGWTRTRTGPDVPGFPGGARTLHARVRDAAVAIAVLPVERASLLPPALADRPPRPRVVSAGTIGGYHYSLPSTARRDVIAVPTTQGVVTIACTAAPPGECEHALRGLRLARGSFVEPGANAAFLARLPGATRTLDAQHLRMRERLAQTRDPHDGARAARRLAGANEAASRTLRPFAPTTHGQAAATVELLDRLGDGYARLAGAVERGDRRGFKLTATAIDADEARLAASLQAWQRRLADPSAPG